MENHDKRPSAYRDAIPGSRPAHVTAAMRMFQKHGSPSKYLDVQFEVIQQPKGFDVVKPSENVLIEAKSNE